MKTSRTCLSIVLALMAAVPAAAAVGAPSGGLFAARKLGVNQALWAKPYPDGRISLPRTRVDLYGPAPEDGS